LVPYHDAAHGDATTEQGLHRGKCCSRYRGGQHPGAGETFSLAWQCRSGSGVLASACGMDKVVSKDLLHGAGLPMIPYRVLESADIDPQNCLEALGLPLVVNLHPLFRFEGNNLVCEVPIAPDEAVLGTEIKVPTPDGTVNLKIPAGVRSGQSLRLQGKGWPRLGGERGDQMVRLQLVTPKDLSPAERECYEKLRTSRSFNPRASIEQTRL
jgi:DnaJ C terminal domain